MNYRIKIGLLTYPVEKANNGLWYIRYPESAFCLGSLPDGPELGIKAWASVLEGAA